MRKESADVVVIGGGVRGMAVAYSLIKAGVDVMVLEKRAIAAGASGLTMGYINVSGKGPDFYTRLSKLRADMYPAYNEELGGGIEYERNGSVRVAETEAEWEQLSRIVKERNQIEGLDMRMLGIEDMRGMEPAISPRLLGGYWCPIDGGVNALKLTRALARNASRLGARIYKESEVLAVRVAAGRIEEVETRRMRISTHVLVNTAGIHVPRISKMMGFDLPVFPERGQLTITEALPKIMHCTIGPYKQYANGQVLLGVTNENVGEDTGITAEMISSRVRKAIRILPVLKKARGIRCTAALRPMTPDRLPIYQKVDGVDDFYVAVGHSGITLAPVTGKIFADLITQGHTDVPLDVYRVERFADTKIETNATKIEND
jgi:glycine/D-amino acid oxidase-like deaminating enzyme